MFCAFGCTSYIAEGAGHQDTIDRKHRWDTAAVLVIQFQFHFRFRIGHENSLVDFADSISVSCSDTQNLFSLSFAASPLVFRSQFQDLRNFILLFCPLFMFPFEFSSSMLVLVSVSNYGVACVTVAVHTVHHSLLFWWVSSLRSLCISHKNWFIWRNIWMDATLSTIPWPRVYNETYIVTQERNPAKFGLWGAPSLREHFSEKVAN